MIALFIYLAGFIGMLLIFNLVFFEMSRAKALSVKNYAWFSTLSKPYNYTRTGSMIFICVLTYLLTGHGDLSGLEWIVYLILFVACGVIADAMTQFIIQKYAQIRCRKMIRMATSLEDEFSEAMNFVEDYDYVVSSAKYDEKAIAKKYIKKEDHLSFIGVDRGEFAKNFGDYPEATYNVDSFSSVEDVQKNLEGTPVRATTLTPNGQMPFKDKRLDVVMDQYSNYNKDEVKRVLKDDGYFIVNQYGSHNLREFLNVYMYLRVKGVWDLESCKMTLKSINFKVEEAYEDYGYVRFKNLSQLHTYFTIVLQDVAANPEKYKAFYLKALQDIKENGFYEMTTYRFLIVAKKEKDNEHE